MGKGTQMTELLKSTDYVDVYRLSRDKRKVEGKVKVGDMKRLAETASNHEDFFTYEITGMTGKLGWPGAIMELHGKVDVPCNRCNKPVVPSHDYPCLDKGELIKDEEPMQKENPFAKLKGMKFRK